MAKITSTVSVLCLFTCFCLQTSGASLCEPYSKFTLDCNTCTCSSSGKEYTCTDIICSPLIYKDKYLIEHDDNGRSILKPKFSRESGNYMSLDDEVSSNEENFRRGQRYVVNPQRLFQQQQMRQDIQDEFNDSDELEGQREPGRIPFDINNGIGREEEYDYDEDIQRLKQKRMVQGDEDAREDADEAHDENED